ncbi:MAG: heavy-metal-associated domain-containing protein [Myxococcales bacterium]|nr:heavy-metal-associated domain-containing protein [Myxococcales bacterium]
MKKLVIALALSLSTAALAKEVTTTLKVEGWHCGGCSDKTEAELKKVTGVKSVKTDLGKGTTEVTYDDAKVKAEQLEKAVATAGFKLKK